MIRIENLVKTFGAKRAVDGISFTVERGEVLGFLGPNGAGKSTTMRMITGFYPPDRGKVSVGGHDVAESPLAAKRLIGYLPENAAAYADMTVRGFLGFAAELRGLSGDARKRAVAPRGRAAASCESVLHQTIDTLSKGYRHRTCLAQSLIHDPEVLILDEPTDGLDPNQKHEVRNLIRRAGREQGDHLLDPHPRGSGRRLHARHHHRPRQDRRQRHAGRTGPAAGRSVPPITQYRHSCQAVPTR